MGKGVANLRPVEKKITTCGLFIWEKARVEKGRIKVDRIRKQRVGEEAYCIGQYVRQYLCVTKPHYFGLVMSLSFLYVHVGKPK